MQLMQENPETKKKLGVTGLLADFISVSADILDMVSPVMADVLDWVVIERADKLPQIESFCAEHELGQLWIVTLDRPPTTPEITVNKGIPLQEILKFEEPLQKWGEKFFSRFVLLKDDKNFWSEVNNNWPKTPDEWLSSSGIRLSNSSVSMGKVQSGSLGFLQRQQQITDVEAYVDELLLALQKTKRSGLHFPHTDRGI
jgi:hypothetical protein